MYFYILFMQKTKKQSNQRSKDKEIVSEVESDLCLWGVVFE